MCRFVAYRGPDINLHEMLYEPEHSLIHQSVHAHEREEPLNGDGWGVGWYDPDVYHHPATYRDLRPAWSDDNMRHISPLVETPTFLAHVRAASPGLAVQRLNCHPFRGGQHTHEDPETLDPLERARRRLTFMHNGSLGAYRAIIRRLQNELSDETFFTVDGSTDSEHAFAAIQEALGADAIDTTVDDLADAVTETLGFLNELKADEGHPEAETQANFLLTDGESMVATRYAHPNDHTPNSLYVGQAEAFHCQDGDFATSTPNGTGAALVASERLWDDGRVWARIPENHLVKIDAQRNVTIEPMSEPEERL